MFKAKEKWVMVSSHHWDATSWRCKGKCCWGCCVPIVSRDINPLLPALALAEPFIPTYGGISWGILKWMNVLGTKITVLNMLQDLWLRESVTIRQEEGNVLETMCAWRIYMHIL